MRKLWAGDVALERQDEAQWLGWLGMNDQLVCIERLTAIREAAGVRAFPTSIAGDGRTSLGPK